MRIIDADALKKHLDNICYSGGLWGEVVKAAIEAIRDFIDGEPTVKADPFWILSKKKKPEENVPVNITWVNHNPEIYYSDIKDKLFTGTGIYFRGKWYWYSSTCEEYLAEYGYCWHDEMHEDIEVVAWMPLPEPYKESEVYKGGGVK